VLEVNAAERARRAAANASRSRATTWSPPSTSTCRRRPSSCSRTASSPAADPARRRPQPAVHRRVGGRARRRDGRCSRWPPTRPTTRGSSSAASARTTGPTSPTPRTSSRWSTAHPGRYPPGSVFKTASGAAMSRPGWSDPAAPAVPASYELGGNTFRNWNRGSTRGRWTSRRPDALLRHLLLRARLPQWLREQAPGRRPRRGPADRRRAVRLRPHARHRPAGSERPAGSPAASGARVLARQPRQLLPQAEELAPPGSYARRSTPTCASSGPLARW
jgi:hypothetical protein